MGIVKTLDNGNIVYVINQDTIVTCTLSYHIKDITINGGKINDTHDIDKTLHSYFLGNLGTPPDTAFQMVMDNLTTYAESWIKDNGLKGTVMNHTCVKPGAWIDGYMFYTSIDFNCKDCHNNNLAKVKNSKVYKDISLGIDPGIYVVEICLEL